MANRTGSILCPSCGKLVGVAADECPYCGRKRPGMWGLTSVLGGIGRQWPFEAVVTGGCVFLYMAMLAAMATGSPENIQIFSGYQVLPPTNEALLRFGAAGAGPVYDMGRWWTVLSAGWLHGDLVHIFFNLYWLRMLAPDTAELYGASRMVVLYTVSSAIGFLTSSSVAHFFPALRGGALGGAEFTVGASAAILGLLGAMIAYGRRTGSHALRRQAWYYAVMMIAFGFLWPRVDNWAHLGGFVGGFVAGIVLSPEKPERPGHTAAALLCLLLTIAAVVASLVDVRWHVYFQ